MLKVDKKGNILRPNGTILGTPDKEGNISRGKVRTGILDIETGEVYNIKDELLGKILLSSFSIFNNIKVEDKTEVKESAKEHIKKKEEKEVSKKKEETYRPGLDSAFIVSGGFSKMFYSNSSSIKTIEERTLEEVNTKYKWSYSNWDDLSERDDLSMEFLVKYKDFVSWYSYLCSHPDVEFDEKHTKLFKEHLMLRNLGLVPFNGKVHRESSTYVPSSIKETRARAQHLQELKAKRKTRKEIRDNN